MQRYREGSVRVIQPALSDATLHDPNATERAGGKTVPRRGGCMGSPHHKAVPRRSMNAPGLGLGVGLGLRLGLGLGLGLGTYP